MTNAESKADPAKHLRFVFFLFKRLEGRHTPWVDRDNVIGQGVAELVRCAAKWDGGHQSGAKFVTYARKSVGGALMSAMRRERNFRHSRAKTSTKRVGGRRLWMFSECPGAVSRGTAVEFAYRDTSAADAERQNFLRLLINEVLADETPAARLVIALRYGADSRGPLTIKETADVMGRSRERIRQVEARAMNKIVYRLGKADAKELVNDSLIELGLNTME